MSGNRIETIFRELRENGRAGLMPFITGGFPTLEATADLLPALEKAGASIVEIGFPFSDPIADGPVIAATMHEALLGGTTPERIMETVASLRSSLELGLVAMVSDSIVQRIGPETFVKDAAAAGFDGLIIPDMDIDAARQTRAIADEHGLTLTVLIAPTSTGERLDQLLELCSGFVYLLARVGITGERKSVDPVDDRVSDLRALTDLPIAVGFGISEPDHVATVTRSADAAIVGSALMRRITEANDPVAAASEMVRRLSAGLRQPVS